MLQSPDSIGATFMVFGGLLGFLLMLLAQAKAQVLNSYSSSLCIANLFDALLRWRPGRVFFVILANIIALLMLYGHILEFVEAWIKLLGVLLSALAGDHHHGLLRRRAEAEARGDAGGVDEIVNWSGVRHNNCRRDFGPLCARSPMCGSRCWARCSASLRFILCCDWS